MNRKKIIRGSSGVVMLLAIMLTMTALNGCGKRDNTPEDSTMESTQIETNEAGNQLIEAIDENGNPVIVELDPDGVVVGVEPNGETVNVPTEKETEIYTGPSNPVPAETREGDIRVTNAAGEFIADINAENLVEPGEDTFDDSQIKHYETVPAVDEENREIVEEKLKIHSVGTYTGVYVENGEDIYLENVAAMLVTNTTDEMLQVARFTMTVNDNPEEEALFQVTDLPAGATALIFELNKRTYNEDDIYTLGQEIHTFFGEETVNRMEEFSVVVEDGIMKLTNLTDKSFDKVYVHYKYVQEGGCYLGGIAYRSSFTSVGPKETVMTGAGHYTDKISRIVMIEGTESGE